MSKVRVMLAEDHAVVREGLKRLIQSEPDLEMVGEAGNGIEAVARAGELQPDILVMDVSMPLLTGLEATRQLKKNFPAIKVLALTVHEDRSYLRALFEAGAAGYLLKRAAAEELLRAIRVIAEGGVHIDPRVASKLVDTPASATKLNFSGTGALTERETEVLRRIAHGYSNKEIGAQLSISVKTVETYKARGMEKLGLRSRVDIVRAANERGWFDAP